MIWISFEILINVFESWLILYFIKNNLHIRPKSILGDLLCIGSCTAFYSSFLIWKLPKVDGLIFIFPFYTRYIIQEKIGKTQSFGLSILLSYSIPLQE